MITKSLQASKCKSYKTIVFIGFVWSALLSSTLLYVRSDITFRFLRTSYSISSEGRLSNYERNINRLDKVLGDISQDEFSEGEKLALKETINLIMKSLQPEEAVGREGNKDTVDVCPEQFFGSRIGYPFWVDGFRTIKCNNSRPLEDIVSAVLIYKDSTSYVTDMLPIVLRGINSTYPNIKVFIVSSDTNMKIHSQNYSNIEFIPAENGQSYSRILKRTLARVKTRYVLIGRDLFHFTWFANLVRSIRVLSNDKSLAVVGGAFRNSSGHWTNGCFQFDTKMRTLTYTQGYHKSINECLYCDMITGSFVAKTSVLIKNVAETELQTEFVFQDLFLKLKQNGHKTMTCPDVMYFMSDETRLQDIEKRQLWLQLARRWEIDIIRYNGKKYKFTCEEIKYKCDMMTTNSFILPTCCFDQMAKSLKFWKDFTTKYNITYEISTGSVLASVKLSDMMPWDLDGDMNLKSKFYPLVKKHLNEFADNKFSISSWENSKCCDKNGEHTGGYFKLNRPLYFEVFGIPILSTEKYLPVELPRIPTQVTLHGITVNGPVNPGLYARNRYGYENYRHAQSWIIFKRKDSHTKYNAGEFKRCKRPRFHGCLDQHPADGNIPFHVDY